MSTQKEKKSSDKNLLNHIPLDLSYSGTAPSKVETTQPKSEVEKREPEDEYKYLTHEGVSKSALALVSGLGFVLIGIILYFFLSKYGETNTYIIIFIALLFSALISFFYLLDELTIRPAFMTSRGAHFISGMFLGALALLIIMILNAYTDWLFLIPIFAVIILMSVSVALFLYAIMWEE